jgi:hypothetical protein
MPFPRVSPEPTRAEKAYGRNFHQESAALQEEINARKTPLLNDLLDLTIYIAYAEKLLGNARINRYLRKNHQPVLSGIERLIAEVSSSKIDLEEEIMTVWSIPRVREELAELIRQCKTNGPQLIRTRHEPVVIVICLRRWRAMLRRYPELEEFAFQAKICPTGKNIKEETVPRQPRAAKKKGQASSETPNSRGTTNEGGRS